MDPRTLVGVGLLTVGLVGYIAGLSMAYPGRSFSISAVMIGLTLVAIGPGASSWGNG